MAAGRRACVGAIAALGWLWTVVAAEAASNRINGVRLSTQGDSTVVEIAGEHAPNFTTFRQDSPRRVIVDVAECDLHGVPTRIGGDGDLVAGVTTSQYGSDVHGISRVIISLAKEAEYRVTTRGGSLYVHLSPGTGGLLVSAGIPVAPRRAELMGGKRAKKNELELPLVLSPRVAADMEHANRQATSESSIAAKDPAAESLALVALAKSGPAAKPAAEVLAPPAGSEAVNSTPGAVASRPEAESVEDPATSHGPPKPVRSERAARPPPVDEPPSPAQPELPEREPRRRRSPGQPTRPEGERPSAHEVSGQPERSEPRVAMRAGSLAAQTTAAQPAAVAAQPAAVRLAQEEWDDFEETEEGEEVEQLPDEALTDPDAGEEVPSPPPTEEEVAAEEEPSLAPEVEEEALLTPPPAADEGGPEQVPPPPATAEEEVEEVSPPPPSDDGYAEAVDEVPQAAPSEVEDRVEVGGALKHMTWVGFQQTMESSRVFVKTTVPVRYHVTEEGDSLVVLELENTRIPLRNNRRFLDTHFFDSAVTLITPREIEGVSRNVRIEIQLRNRVPYRAGQDENMVFLDFQRP